MELTGDEAERLQNKRTVTFLTGETTDDLIGNNEAINAEGSTNRKKGVRFADTTTSNNEDDDDDEEDYIALD